MSPFILSIFNSICFLIYSYLIICILLKKKQTRIKKIVAASIAFFLMYYLILCLLDSVYAIFFSGLYCFLFIKILFEENVFISLLISVITNTTKLLFKIIMLLILNNKSLTLIHTYKTLDLTAVYLNVISMFLATIFILIFSKQLRKMIKWLSTYKHREIILLIITYVNFIVTIMFQPFENIFTLPVLTDFLIIFIVSGIGIISVSSEKKLEILKRYYQDIFEYAKANEKILNEYKMQVHENKNKIIMIKSLLDESQEEAIHYIDTIIKEMHDSSNYWLTELKYIPLLGVRNFINYKLNKLKSLGSKIEVFVSNELENIDTSTLNEKEYNDITTILGIILDNMIDSIMVSEEKLISINIYLDNDMICGEFANTFSEDIDIDRLYEIGYTTKGGNHGVGLPLINKIIKQNDRFNCVPSIMDKFFVQLFTVKLYQAKNKKKLNKKN